MLQMLAGRPLELPIFYDWETVTAEDGRANGLDGKTVTACAAAFCRAIEPAYTLTSKWATTPIISPLSRTTHFG